MILWITSQHRRSFSNHRHLMQPFHPHSLGHCVGRFHRPILFASTMMTDPWIFWLKRKKMASQKVGHLERLVQFWGEKEEGLVDLRIMSWENCVNWSLMVCRSRFTQHTPWKFNIAPENKPSQKDSNLPIISLKVQVLNILNEFVRGGCNPYTTWKGSMAIADRHSYVLVDHGPLPKPPGSWAHGRITWTQNNPEGFSPGKRGHIPPCTHPGPVRKIIVIDSKVHAEGKGYVIVRSQEGDLFQPAFLFTLIYDTAIEK